MPLLETIYNKERSGDVSIVPFFYSTSFANSVLTAGGTITQVVGIQSDSHFVARYFNITAYAAGLVVATATAPLLIQLFDSASGRTLFDNPQPIQNVCGGVAAAAGTGSLPFIFPEPWLVRSGGTIQVTITNLGASAVVRADVSLPGFKVFGNL
jgi:hypothetical protein